MAANHGPIPLRTAHAARLIKAQETHEVLLQTHYDRIYRISGCNVASHLLTREEQRKLRRPRTHPDHPGHTTLLFRIHPCRAFSLSTSPYRSTALLISGSLEMWTGANRSPRV